MPFKSQKILPAIRNMKDFERIMKTGYQNIVLLETHIGQVKSLVQYAHQHKKKILIHVDLIQGLKSDEYAAEYLCQDIKPDGLISTRANVIATAKKKGIMAVQRLFLIDSAALEMGYALLRKTKPDYIEILPGIIPEIIHEVHTKTDIPIFAGGFIRTEEEVERALASGATAVTTSRINLWEKFAPKV